MIQKANRVFLIWSKNNEGVYAFCSSHLYSRMKPSFFPVQALDMVQTPSTEQKQRVRKWIQLKAYTNSSLPRQSCIRAAHPCSFVRCFSSALVIPAPHYDSNGMLCEPHPVKRTVKKYKISLVSSRALLAAFYAARQSVCFSIGVSTPRLRWTRLVL